MTKTCRVLHLSATLASLAWATYWAGNVLMVRLIFSAPSESGHPYDVRMLWNIEFTLFGPLIILWLLVFGLEWAAKHQARSGLAEIAWIREFLNRLRPRHWIWLALCVLWPAWIPIPGAIQLLDLPKINTGLRMAFLAAVFVVPLILAWFALVAIERALARRKARPVS